MSTFSRKEFFINLRKSCHVHLRVASETHIFLNDENDRNARDFTEIVQMKSSIEFDLNRINELLVKLEDKLEQYKFGLPTLLINGEKKIYEGTRNEIDKLCLEIKNKLESSLKDAKNNADRELPNELKQNIRTHLANRLTEEYEKFQVFQKMFSSILYEKGLKRESLLQENNIANDQIEGEGLQEMLVVMDEGQATMLKERSAEIEQVITDTLDLHSLLHQIQLMTVQQGSLLDRIDVNLDKTRQNLDKTIVRLERTEKSFSLHQKRLILFFITLAIFVTTLLILRK